MCITLDRQNQFNKAQVDTHLYAVKISEGLKKEDEKQRRLYINHPLYHGMDKDIVGYQGVPQKEIRILSSQESIGLQIVDIYLWIVNRYLSGRELSSELKAVAGAFLRRSFIDGISMEGMAHRWKLFEEKLPSMEDLTEEQIEFNRQMVEKHREKVTLLNI